MICSPFFAFSMESHLALGILMSFKKKQRGLLNSRAPQIEYGDEHVNSYVVFLNLSGNFCAFPDSIKRSTGLDCVSNHMTRDIALCKEGGE